MGSSGSAGRPRAGIEATSRSTASAALDDPPLTLEQIASASMTSLLETGRYQSDTAAYRADDLERFARFLRNGHGITDPIDITPEHVRARMEAVSSDGRRPTDQTKRVRLFSVRAMSQEAVRLGLMDHDPTLGIAVPKRALLLTRALTDPEINRGRARAVPSSRDRRRSIAWSLSEATARTSEIGLVRARDVDEERERVWLPGSRTVDARWGPLTEWALTQLRRRLCEVDDPDEPLMVWRTPPRALPRAASQAVTETLRAAGLIAPDIRPRSIVAWAGCNALERGLRESEIARMLGMRSLDETVEFIGFDWRGGDRA